MIHWLSSGVNSPFICFLKMSSPLARWVVISSVSYPETTKCGGRDILPFGSAEAGDFLESENVWVASSLVGFGNVKSIPWRKNLLGKGSYYPFHVIFCSFKDSKSLIKDLKKW